MAIDDLKTEYARTKTEILKYKAEILKYNIAEPRVRHYLKRSSEKTKDIKKIINQNLLKGRIYKVNDTLEAFEAIAQSPVIDQEGRLKGSYSYDVRDSETFKYTFNVENKLRKYRKEREERLHQEHSEWLQSRQNQPKTPQAEDIKVLDIEEAQPAHEKEDLDNYLLKD